MMDGRGPIFIGGLSHSGKTELRIALGTHPEISLTRRTYLWDRYYGRFGDLARSEHFERCLSAMCRDEGVAALGPDPVRIRREFLEGPGTYARLFGLFHAHHAERLGKRRWGEQLGFIERFADPIFETFPSARMIHMVRDPRSRAGEAATERRRPGSVGWETARWLRSAELAQRNAARYPDGYRVIRYESLADEPVDTLRQLCGFLDERYLPAMGDALGRMTFDRSDAYRAGTISRGVKAETAFMDLAAADELPRFGYEPARLPMSAREQVAFLLVDRPLNRMTMAAWRTFGRGRIPRTVGG
jgi:hypothetical protein